MISHIFDRGDKCEGSRYFTFSSEALNVMVAWLGDPAFGYTVVVHEYKKEDVLFNFAGNEIDNARKLYFKLKLEIEIKEIEAKIAKLSQYKVIEGAK